MLEKGIIAAGKKKNLGHTCCKNNHRSSDLSPHLSLFFLSLSLFLSLPLSWLSVSRPPADSGCIHPYINHSPYSLLVTWYMASIDFFRCLIAGEHLVFVRQKKKKKTDQNQIKQKNPQFIQSGIKIIREVCTILTINVFQKEHTLGKALSYLFARSSSILCLKIKEKELFPLWRALGAGIRSGIQKRRCSLIVQGKKTSNGSLLNQGKKKV